MGKYKIMICMIKLVFFTLLISGSLNSLIPGVSYHSYKEEDPLQIKVGKINSVKTQFPFAYYNLAVCNDKNYTRDAENLGEILSGGFIYSTKYDVKMKKDEYCKLLCKRTIKNEYETNLFAWVVERDYTSNFYLDSLPAGLNYTYKNGVSSDRVIYDHGIPIGEYFGSDNNYSLYNHFTFLIFVNNDSKSEKPYSIVEFNIIPWSINHEVNSNGEVNLLCAKNQNEFESRNNWQIDNFFSPAGKKDVVYSYDVIFIDSPSKWSSRWDHYMLSHKDDNIHWLSFLNSTIIILIFTALLAHIFCRALKRDIDYINTKSIADDFFDDSGWKQVSNDIFRKPRHSMLLCSFVGTGIQLFAMLLITLLSGAIGFLSPDNRGALLTLMILLFVFMGGFGGYWSTRFFKMFNQMNWLKNAIATAILYPSFAFAVFVFINLFLTFEGSSGAIPFTTIITLLLLWICCSSPLVLIGAFLGIKKKAMKNPGKINVVPSSIPKQPWYLELKFICAVSGLLPFGAIFIELVYVMASIWKHYFFSLFGFLFIVVIIMLITSSEISMIFTYFQLCKWWWKSFLISGSVAFYIFAYSIYYYLVYLNITRLSSLILYFGYMFLLSLTSFLITGSIGFVSTYFFLRKIYSMIKLD